MSERKVLMSTIWRSTQMSDGLFVHCLQVPAPGSYQLAKDALKSTTASIPSAYSAADLPVRTGKSGKGKRNFIQCETWSLENQQPPTAFMDLIVEAAQADRPGVEFNVEYFALNEKKWHETNTDGSANQRDIFAASAKIGLWVPPGKIFYCSSPTKDPLAHLQKAAVPHNSKTEIPESVVQMAFNNLFRKLYASPFLAKHFQVQVAATSNVTHPHLNRKRPDFCAFSEDGGNLVRIKSPVAFRRTF